MKTISLREVTNKNFDKVVKLSNTLDDSQKEAVAPNMVSLAQAYVNQDKAWPRAIYLDDEPIGFVMLALFDSDTPKEDRPSHYLWRFMIAKEHQSKGYGKQVLDLIYRKCQEDKVRFLFTSCVMKTEMPYQFYIKYGFIDTHEMDEDEEVLKLTIK